MSLLKKILLGSFVIFSTQVYAQNPADYFKANSDWINASKVSAVGNKLQVTPAKDGNILVLNAKGSSEHLNANEHIGDSVLETEFLVPEGSDAKLYVQGRYAIDLKNVNNEWQRLYVTFRAPRYNEASAKVDAALIMEVRINGETV